MVKICTVCEEEFEPDDGRQRVCDKCQDTPKTYECKCVGCWELFDSPNPMTDLCPECQENHDSVSVDEELDTKEMNRCSRLDL